MERWVLQGLACYWFLVAVSIFKVNFYTFLWACLLWRDIWRDFVQLPATSSICRKGEICIKHLKKMHVQKRWAVHKAGREKKGMAKNSGMTGRSEGGFYERPSFSLGMMHTLEEELPFLPLRFRKRELAPLNGLKIRFASCNIFLLATSKVSHQAVDYLVLILWYLLYFLFLSQYIICSWRQNKKNTHLSWILNQVCALCARTCCTLF